MKVAVAASLVALLLPAAARAEAVPGSEGATDAAFALAADGTPRVAFLSGGGIVVASRSAGGWTSETAARLPGPNAVVDRVAGRFVLVQDANGGWLVLQERTPAGWRAHVLVRGVPSC